MLATHRVKDNNGETVGFIIDNMYTNLYITRRNIKRIDNLKIINKGIIRADKQLPDVKYAKAVIQAEYGKLLQAKPFERDIEKRFEDWKRDKSNRVLFVEGARQIGKTTELLKFAYKNFNQVIYVNLADDRYNFKRTLAGGILKFNMCRYNEVANLPPYCDDATTLLIIDEIQEDTKVFNSIRTLQDNLHCKIAVTGSYLARYFGVMMDKKSGIADSDNAKPFFPLGNIEPITMFNMSFSEFCKAFNCGVLLQTVDLAGGSADKDYKTLDTLYKNYLEVGGYPGAVQIFKRTKSIDKAQEEISRILDVFKKESNRYFSNAKEVEIFDLIYKRAIIEMLTEKRGNGKNIVDNITNIIKTGSKGFITRDEVSKAIVWLKKCGILGTCSMVIDGDFDTEQPGRRIYFVDCGVASYIMKQIKLDESNAKGLIAETFVFSELNRLYYVDCLNKRVKETLSFSISGNYELDFVVVGKGGNIENKVFGIEVKSNSGAHASLNEFIAQNYIDIGVMAKFTKGGVGDKFNTIPIYTVGARFPYKPKS